jgi:hypothetical protein
MCISLKQPIVSSDECVPIVHRQVFYHEIYFYRKCFCSLFEIHISLGILNLHSLTSNLGSELPLRKDLPTTSEAFPECCGTFLSVSRALNGFLGAFLGMLLLSPDGHTSSVLA